MTIWGWRSSRTVVVGAAIVAFVVCCLMPVGYLLAVTSVDIGSTSVTVLLDARQRGLLYTTGLLGTGTALLSTAIGVPLGVALARIAMPFKTALRLALAAPVLLPPYVVGLAWIYVGGSRGLVSTLPAAIAVLSLVFYPLSMLATEVGVRRVDGRLEEAALMYAPPRRVLRRVTLPLAAPHIWAAALVIFVLAVSEFGVPGLLRVRVYTTEVFTAFAALYDFPRALLLAVPLLLLCLVVATSAGLLLGGRYTVSRWSGATPPAVFDAWRRPAQAAAMVVLTVALGLPIAILLREALTAKSLAAVLVGSGSAVANSLVLAAAGASAVSAVALSLGYGRARADRRLGSVVDVLCVVLFAVPSTLVGVALIGLWNRPGPFGAAYGTVAMLLFACLARFVPIAALALAAIVGSVPVSHEEAAAVSGAGWLRTMTHIVVPQVWRGLAATWVVVFVLAFGELGVSILVAPPGETTLPIRIYTLIANTPSSHVAALALLQTIVILTPLVLFGVGASLRRPA